MYDRDNDIERIFNDESRSKKRDGYGAMKRKATRGSSRKALRFPSDNLTAKQKRMLNGEIVISSVYQDINKVPTWDYIKTMDKDKAIELLTTLKKYHSGASLQKHWNVRPATHYAFLEKIGLHKPKVNTGMKKSKKDSVYKSINDVMSYDEFLDMDLGKRKEVLTQLRKDISMSALKRHWGISQGTLYTQLYRLGIIEYKGSDEDVSKRIEKSVDEIKEETSEDKHTIEVCYLGEKIDEITVPNSKSNTIVLNNDTPVDQLRESEIICVKEEEVANYSTNNSFVLNIKGKSTRIELENKIFRALMSMDLDKTYDFEITVKES